MNNDIPFNLPEVWRLLTPYSIFFSVLLGFMIGCFYGYPLNRSAAPVFPWSLWVVGIAFVIGLGVWAVLSGVGQAEPQISRMVLWTAVCVGIPTGRFLRLRWEVFRVKRRREELPGPESELVQRGHDQNEDV